MSLKENLNMLGKAAEKYKTFSVPIEKKLLILINLVMKVLSLYLAK